MQYHLIPLTWFNIKTILEVYQNVICLIINVSIVNH